MNKNERINSILGRWFDLRLINDPELMEAMPDKAHLIMQLEGNDSFNAWSKRIGLMQATDKGYQVVYVVFRLEPSPSNRTSPRQIALANIQDMQLQPA